MEKQTGELKVALVGPYPPPYGGVSIHVQRLHGQSAANNIISTVFDNTRHVKKVRGVLNLSRFWNWPRVLFSRQDIIHVHTTSTHWIIPALFYYVAKLKGASFVISFHSLRYGARDFGIIGSRMIKKILSSASHCIADSPDIKKGLISLGARTGSISIIPAFLPPTVYKRTIDEIPREVTDFMASHSPVITAGAFRAVLYQGVDRYGIDMCIEMCSRLKSDYPDIGVVFCLPDIGDYEYFSKLEQEIKSKNIQGNFYFVKQPVDEVFPIWQKSDIFVRPTSSDADAVSLREALYLKTPSLASDAAPRPAGTVNFKNRDVEDFISRVKMVWDNYDDFKAKAEALEMESGLEDILNIYRGLAGKSGNLAR
jgi:glycosyltransferase involved in cell wall biosynthesis